MSIHLVATDAEILACFPVLAQLRPHLTAETLLQRVRIQEREGYRLAARRDDHGTVRACAGYRFLHLLHRGHVLYVDDLVTDAAARSNGHGHALMEWLTAEARAAGCEELQLDSGTHRHEAHRFYFRERMTISCYHFSLPLK
ncbi:MAG TPA: GNAT family N-acetyltransferase [Candidatus Synoicihabitans sp.]|nr:GNAT family N-acetyltransferase [Candidatus Synoicihabitans sp.]